jgi:hypothetical protein
MVEIIFRRRVWERATGGLSEWIGLGSATKSVTLDGQRNKIKERSIKHTGQGLAEFVGWLDEIATGEPATMAAALEVPHGALVETLLAHGFAVFSINPKQLDRFRDRHTVGGAKDDRRDAFVLAASMVTGIGPYLEVKAESPFIVRVRELSWTANDFEREHRRLCNQLRELLFRSFPPSCACVQQLTSHGYGICWRKRLSHRRRRGYGQPRSRKY